MCLLMRGLPVDASLALPVRPCIDVTPSPPSVLSLVFFFTDTATTEIYTLSLHDALPISMRNLRVLGVDKDDNLLVVEGSVPGPNGGYLVITKAKKPPRERRGFAGAATVDPLKARSEEHTSELQSRQYLVCRLLLEKKKQK